MMAYLFLIVNLLIGFSYYILFSFLLLRPLSAKLISIITLMTAQIIMTQLIFGLLGWLYVPAVAAINIFVALGILAWVWVRERNKGKCLQYIKEDSRRFAGFVRSILSPENIWIVFLLVLVSLWIILAAFLLPPRGVDDMVYHLPEVFESVQEHKLTFLPVSIRKHQAFPHNAEMLFMWPTLFFHNTIGANLVQFVFALIGMLTTYGLARLFDVRARYAFFVAGLFVLSPVVLAQAGSAYNDLIINVVVLLNLYLLFLFHKQKRMGYLYLAAVGMGMMLGMKYTMAICFFTMLPLGLLPLWKKKKFKSLGIFVTIVTIFCGYWYIKNLIVYKNTMYPVTFSSRGMVMFYSNPDMLKSLSWMHKMREIPIKISLLFSEDIGLGSLHGGYGLVFWGIAFWCWICLLGDRLKNKQWLEFWILMQGIFGLGMLFLIPLGYFGLSSRFVLFVVALCLIAMGKLFMLFANMRPIFLKFIVLCCCYFAFLQVSSLALDKIPSYEVDFPIEDRISGNQFSKNRYLKLGWTQGNMVHIWEALDDLTRDDPKGLSVYLGASGGDYWTTPLYGSRLQNHIWNLKKGDPQEPDAFIFYRPEGHALGLRKKIGFLEVFFDPKQELIVMNNKACLFVKADVMRRKDIKVRLAKFYEGYFGEALKKISSTPLNLIPGVPIVATTVSGHLMKYYQVSGKIDNQVILCPKFLFTELIKRNHWPSFYTMQKPVRGFRAKEVLNIVTAQGRIRIFENRK